MADLDKTNFNEVADQAIDKYWKKGMVADALLWSKIVALYRDRIRELEKVAKNR